MVLLTILLPLCLMIFDIYKERKIYSPAFVFNTIFFISLFLYNFKLSYIQQDLSNRTLTVLLLCEVCFNIPVLVSYIFDIKKSNFCFKSFFRKNKITKINENIDTKTNNENNQSSEVVDNRVVAKKFVLNKVLELCIFIFAVLLFIIQIIYSKYLPFFSKLFGGEGVYINFGIPSVTGFFYSLCILMGAYSLLKSKNYYKYFYLLMGLLIISRQLIISIIVEGCVLFILNIKKIDKKYIIAFCILGVCCVLGFSIIGNFRTGESSFLEVAQFKEKYNWIPTSLKWIYSYFCFSVSNINNLINMTPGCINHGTSCLNLLIPNIFGFNFESKFKENFLISENFNVSTFIPELYLDFGIAGVAIFCLFIGIVAVLVYRNLNKHYSLQFFYIIIIHNIVFMFFINMFLYLPVMGQVIFIVICFMLLNNLFNKYVTIENKRIKFIKNEDRFILKDKTQSTGDKNDDSINGGVLNNRDKKVVVQKTIVSDNKKSIDNNFESKNFEKVNKLVKANHQKQSKANENINEQSR